MSALPQFTMQEMIEAGVHFGHKTKRWNPRMAPYLFGIRNDVHIIDLQQTQPLVRKAMQAIREVVSGNGRVLFVGTKTQAAPVVAEYAKRCGQYYVNHRWLGGMLTNWKTVSHSIKKLRKLEELIEKEGGSGHTKQELLQLTRERDKMERALGGIKDMGGIPDLLFVIDTNKESIAIEEAQCLGIPIIAILDSNSNPNGITYPIPGNDDSSRAIRLYCRLVSDAVLGGIQESLTKAGVDIGESADGSFGGEEGGVDRKVKASAKKKPGKKADDASTDGAEADATEAAAPEAATGAQDEAA